MTFRTRFAPSPTGPLHLGHAYSAMLAHDLAHARNGSFFLRIEDIDQSRARAKWEHQIYDDLRWLGLEWEMPALRQSDNMAAYQSALEKLTDMGVTYPCYCSRKDIQAALQAPQEGAEPVFGPDGPVYPGTCRDLPPDPDQGGAPALRLNMRAALQLIDETQHLSFEEIGGAGPRRVAIDRRSLITEVGDVVLSRRDMGTSYHLSVVIDDAAQQITHVVRGKDLFDATKIHVVLQYLLGFDTPVYHHHKLIRDDAGKRLAKRDDARAIAKYRADGLTRADIRGLVGLV